VRSVRPKVCRIQQQQGEAKTVENENEKKKLFVASYFATNSSTGSCFVDGGCTNHMTFDQKLFKNLDKIVVSKVRIGNGSMNCSKIQRNDGK
jgi:hypothetical protein